MSEIIETAVLQNSSQEHPYGKKKVRLGVSLFYYIQGICFASWASRIPELKSTLQLSDAELGTVLLALPLGQLVTMYYSGKLTFLFGSRRMLTIAVPLYAFTLTLIGLSNTGLLLALNLMLFGIAGNLCNIALNTQGVVAENFYGKPIMTSFHGAWSLGGFSGALIGLLMVNLHVAPLNHFWIVAAIAWIHVFINYRFLLVGGKPTSRVKSDSKNPKKWFIMPETSLVQLGVIAFCCMATEGAMFDWSGVYFQDIVHAPKKFVILGYTSFMIMMAMGRFFGDKLIVKYGRKRLLQTSGIVISVGMFTAVLFPYLIPAVIGFMLVGIGVSSIVPMTYSLAGNTASSSPSVALATVSTVGYFGFLMGPPLIGYISQLSSLQYSYAVIGCFGLLITAIVAKINAIK